MAKKHGGKRARQDSLQIGWAHCDLTPDFPVQIPGQFHARISEGILDPITATVMAISGSDGRRDEAHVILVSLDWLWVFDDFRDAVRRQAVKLEPSIQPKSILFNATHTHTGPHPGPDVYDADGNQCGSTQFIDPGVDLEITEGERYFKLAVKRLSAAIVSAWRSRQPGTVEFGIEFAVVSHNRRIQDIFGTTAMYGNMKSPEFSNVEGHEEHSVQLLATRDAKGALTGLVVNVACPSQVSQLDYRLSADFWHEVRLAVRQKFGPNVNVLPQCAAAGDLHPANMFILPDLKAWERMNATKGYGGDYPQRQIIADRLISTIERTLPVMAKAGPASPILRHTAVDLELPHRIITRAEYESAKALAMIHQGYYHSELDKLNNTPDARSTPRWYVNVAREYRRWRFNQAVVDRYESQRNGPAKFYPAEVHCIRIGEIAIATNPFELFHDFGLRIRSRSTALQTFIVQLTGAGTYLPTERAARAGGYSAIPASGPVGPEGGAILVNKTLSLISSLMED